MVVYQLKGGQDESNSDPDVHGRVQAGGGNASDRAGVEEVGSVATAPAGILCFWGSEYRESGSWY